MHWNIVFPSHSISRSLLLKLLKFLKLLPYCNFLHIHINNNRDSTKPFSHQKTVRHLGEFFWQKMLWRNTYGTLPYKLMRNELLLHRWSETRGNSITDLHDQEHFLMKYKVFHIRKAVSAALTLSSTPHPHPSLQKEKKLILAAKAHLQRSPQDTNLFECLESKHRTATPNSWENWEFSFFIYMQTTWTVMKIKDLEVRKEQNGAL